MYNDSHLELLEIEGIDTQISCIIVSKYAFKI